MRCNWNVAIASVRLSIKSQVILDELHPHSRVGQARDQLRQADHRTGNRIELLFEAPVRTTQIRWMAGL